MPARIVHAFLDDLPSTDHDAALIVHEILEDEIKFSDETLKAIADVFECAFIWYTNPQQRTEFIHRDTHAYVARWKELASFRRAVNVTEYYDGTVLLPEQRQTVFQAYLKDFASRGLRPGQEAKRMKSYAEAHLRDIAANKDIVFVIWEVGLPRMRRVPQERDTDLQESACAAEQRAQIVETNTLEILGWLDSAARSILHYKKTAKYLEALRRAGQEHGVSGITTAEQAERKELRRAQANVRKGKRLAERWSQHAVTFYTITWPDWALLQNHWNGSGVKRVLEIQTERGNHGIRMPVLRTDLQES